MKKQTVIKLFSLLSFGSIIGMIASSCVGVKASNNFSSLRDSSVSDTKTNPSISNNTTNPPTSSSSMDKKPLISPVVTPISNNKEAVQTYISELNASNFNFVNGDKPLLKHTIKAEMITGDNIKLKNANAQIIDGWTINYKIEKNNNTSTNDDGILKFKVTFTKDENKVESSVISVEGFKTLKSSITSALLKNKMIKDQNGITVSKTVLDLGSANFDKLFDLNKETSLAINNSSSNNRTSLVSESNSDATTNQDKTTGLNEKFKLLVSNPSVFKTNLDSIKEDYPEFISENLFLSGKTRVISLWKNENDWHGNYYLTSNGDNKLSIKYKGADWSIDLDDGLVIQDLLPDDVKIYVSKIGDRTYNESDYANQSNLQAYIDQKQAESTYTNSNKNKNNKYEFSDGKFWVKPNKLKSNDPDPMSVIINPITIDHPTNFSDKKIYFKAKYVFGNDELYDDQGIFGTKLKFKKAFKWEHNYNQNALRSEWVSSVWYGSNYIPRSNVADPRANFQQNENLFDNNFKSWRNEVSEYYWNGNATDKGFINSIYGSENSLSGLGIVQLIETDHRIHNNQDYINNINGNENTNFLIYPRISYKKTESVNDEQTYGYLWSNSITILNVKAPVSSNAG
ncbi:hypothetical protein LNO75_00370 [Mycoplasma sp. T363T]|uniref:hypothetical protein n=1 Tax=Mycoplasma bradburyae TaxID=2963128 RepID=UPI0023428648|nr:hypothetical protein [Mycoplasma bradburyae]MDC4163035.1 hypothetical protein [Mycoplasma bradburyae]